MAYSDPKLLSRAVGVAVRKMDNFCKSRFSMLGEYTGRLYGSKGDSRARPINLIHQATTTLVPNLVYNDPKAAISTQYLAYRPYAEILELALNHLIEEIDMRYTLRQVITDAIFLAGFIKVGIGVSGKTLDIDGFLHDIGQPYADRVDPDDMIIDPLARTWEECRFIGNRFRIDSDVLLETGIYEPDKIKQLASRHTGFRRKEAASLSSRTRSDQAEVDETSNMVDLVELWLPEENLIVTMPWEPTGEVRPEFLHTIDYEGPERGPYTMLGFAFVPDNIMPVAPANVWYDLHTMANTIARKIARQAERQKSVLAYESSAWQDAQEIIDADDSESVMVDDINSIKEVSYGGASDDGYKYMDWAKSNFSEMSMNIELLSGAGTNEPTATQAEIVQANTSVRLADMQSSVYHFSARAMKHLAYFLHTDPLIELPVVKRVQGQDIQGYYTPEVREGDWLDYNIKVRPYSMARQDPNVKVRRVMELSANIIPAFAQAFQMLGPAFNIEGALNLVAREMGIEEIDEIINSQALNMQLARMQQLLAQGVPMDPKVAKMIMGASAPGVMPMSNRAPMLPGGGQPGQQMNPGGMMQSGITPGTEVNSMRQETAGELQQTYNPNSTAGLAAAMV